MHRGLALLQKYVSLLLGLHLLHLNFRVQLRTIVFYHMHMIIIRIMQVYNVQVYKVM
jgi:hypothetical protein